MADARRARWTPKSGARALLAHHGQAKAERLLAQLLAGTVAARELAAEPYPGVLRCIGDRDTAWLLDDASGARSTWLRVWAARTLAYLGPADAAVEPLLRAVRDPHWRVRMTAVQTLGRLGVDGVEEELSRAARDAHERVRAAAVLALGRAGNELALPALQDATDDAVERVRAQADRALARVEKRVKGRG